MSSNIRWVILSYGIMSLIGVFLLNRIVDGMVGLAGVDDPLADIIPIPVIAGVVGGIAVFVILIKHPKTTDFGLDVIKEIRKVTWPTVVETRASTVVVIILTIIISIILGVFDYIFASLTSIIYS